MANRKARKSDAVSVPKYVAVHAAIKARGRASATEVCEELGLEKKQVVGALARLRDVGAVERVERGVWSALDMPEDFPKRRGRPASDDSVRSLIVDALRRFGEVNLSGIVADVAARRGTEDDDDRRKVRAKCAHALVLLSKEGVVCHVGSRGTYRYALTSQEAS